MKLQTGEKVLCIFELKSVTDMIDQPLKTNLPNYRKIGPVVTQRILFKYVLAFNVFEMPQMLERQEHSRYAQK